MRLPAASLALLGGCCCLMDSTPLVGQKYSIAWGPLTVPAGTDATQCVVLQLSNADEIYVHQLHVTGAHHMIVYRDDVDQTESATPSDCTPFSGALDPSGMVAPLMVTSHHDDELTLPDGVAYRFAPHQMIRIELHYINSGDSPTQESATAEFYAVDKSTIHDEAGVMLIGTPDVALPPNATATVDQAFVPSQADPDLVDASVFAAAGFTHQYGTAVGVSGMGQRAPIYAPQSFEWNAPSVTTIDPPLAVAADQSFDVACSYYNSTAGAIGFGSSPADEVCFFWAYYFPATTARVCVHDAAAGDVCCPGGAPLCAQILQ